MNIQITILIAGLIFIFPWVLRRMNLIRDTQDLQNIATSSGILFTFLGIAYGLWNFDVQNIDTAVPELLEGMKFAFFTSIAGLASSLALRLNDAKVSLSEDNETKEMDSDEVMREMLGQLKKLNSNVSGEGDSSLVMQIQRMRNDITDKQDDLNKEFKAFAENMAKSNIDALTEAIDKVMGEFNTTINEKLGASFETFRDSVVQLNSWQESHKEQLTSQTESMEKTRAILETVVEHTTNMKDDYASLRESSQQFKSMTENLDQYLKNAVLTAESFKVLAESLEGQGKVVKDEVQEIVNGSLNEMEKLLNGVLSEFGTSMASISSKLANDFQKVQEALSLNSTQ